MTEQPQKPRLRKQTLDLARHPGKWFTKPATTHYRKSYHGRFKYARAVFVFDMILIGLVIGMGLIALFLAFFKPMSIADRVKFEATVAPREIVAGDPSTLVLRWTNLTGEELRNARLYLEYPEHFLLQEVTSDYEIEENQLVKLGTVAEDGTGQLKIRGVMFGDVGGEQVFKSLLVFDYGEADDFAYKVSEYTFSPVASTLALELSLPERLVAYQEMTGTIIYKNTGEIDFPEISIEPVWPAGFSLVSSEPALTNGVWRLPAIEAGEEGEMSFVGRLDSDQETETFQFDPSFSFGETRYVQEPLIDSLEFIPPPVKLSVGSSSGSLSPGSTATFSINYENTSEFPITDIEIKLDSTSPFFTSFELDSKTIEIDELAPGETGEGELSLRLRSSILQSETDTYENLSADIKAVASYVLGDGEPQRITSASSSITSSITSPIVLESFGRYASPQGDQLGRGPLPPYVGEETKYWIFVNVYGTTNVINNVQIEGQLASGVRFTGKQTVSVGDSVSYDSGSNTISWSTSSINPTFAPGAKVVGIAFEVGITPNENQAGTSPTLLSNITITGRDAVTGAFVSSSGATVSTNLPYDSMAAGLGVVEL